MDSWGSSSADGGHSDAATVTITVTPVNGAPVVATDDTTTTDEDTLVTFDVLGNDTGGDGDPLSILSYTQPANGAVVFNGGDSTLTYTPNGNFFGSETFTYTVTDGDDTDTAAVRVTVNAVNDMPVTSGDSYTAAEDGTVTVSGPGVLANDTDLEGDPLTAVLFSDTANGVVNLHPDGSFTYTPNADFNGIDSFEYYAKDATRDSNLSFVNITVTPAEDDVVARDDANTTTAGIPVDGNVLTNDIAQNPDGPDEVLSVTTTGPLATTGGGSVLLASNGAYSYTPASGYTGTDTFEYTVADGVEL